MSEQVRRALAKKSRMMDSVVAGYFFFVDISLVSAESNASKHPLEKISENQEAVQSDFIIENNEQTSGQIGGGTSKRRGALRFRWKVCAERTAGS